MVNSAEPVFCAFARVKADECCRLQIWSLGLTIHEVAMNRFPFPPEGEPPLGPIELLTYIVAMDTPELKDDPEQGVKWTRAIQDFIRLW